jgi:nicotinamidase-related amidase
MPITKLDDVAALVVVDLQKGIVVLPTVHPTGEIIDRVARLARAFRNRGMPVVLVNVTGAAPRSNGCRCDGGEIHASAGLRRICCGAGTAVWRLFGD